MSKDKIAIVIQRYGKEINGGAEKHAYNLASNLIHKYEVEILTTTAVSYTSWDNYFDEGTEITDGIIVRRFNSKKKDFDKAQKLTIYLEKNLKYSKYKFTINNFFHLLTQRFKYRYTNKIFKEWIQQQGPYCQDIVNYLKVNRSEYKAVVFFTYLFYPTYCGIREVSEKSILIPTVHDETPFYFKGFKNLFQKSKFIMYNTLSEKKLVETIYPVAKKTKSDIAGVGFDKINIILDPSWSKPVYRYFIYIGRVDVGKNCDVLIDYFEKLQLVNTKLILIGENHLKVETNDNVIFTGFISEEEKWNYLKNSEALIIPSLYESLSMVTLEAMSIGIPVLANAKCEVLNEHINNSKAGFTYTNFKDFKIEINKILSLSKDEKLALSKNGKKYVNDNYQWEIIIEKFIKAINEVSSN
ncbi:glycosyltransferase family 4 protein [Apibacter sp. HY039]|uniref:glycosyltransferase family 4 protein n=1 Tax=Apibacter sp. HY039 TaxID=2501476 RepID=UPI000FEB6205|nr:glycosyltransferase family 4 protein [Apibacter sp. HY039]